MPDAAPQGPSQARIRPLISAVEIENRRRELAAAISRDYRGKELLMVCILKGSMPFFVDLGRDLLIPVLYDYVGVSSYGDGTESSGEHEITAVLGDTIEGKDVLLVDDIVDSGLTVSRVMEIVRGGRPASLKLAALLDKPDRRRTAVEIDYLGFTVSDHFVVGYGLDHGQRYRNLPYIGIVEELSAGGEPWVRAGG